MSSPRKRWETVEIDEALAGRLARDLDLPRSVIMLLVGRGMRNRDDVERFLNPRLSDLSDPLMLPGMERAVDRIWDAVREHDKIVVYGDYDVDGITATALLVSVLQRMGGQVRPFLPSRLADGYGLTVGALERCISVDNPDLIITVDCGTGASDAVELSRRLGVDVVVTDHHEVSGGLAPALSVVNPKRLRNENTTSLSGVGVAFKLCHAIVKHGLHNERREISHIDLRNWLDLVAIGTVADMVPLLGENRILVRHGLARINSPQPACAGSSPRPGIEAIKEVAHIGGSVDCYHLGFVIGPRLNAAGRLGSAETALELLLTSDRERARDLAGKLDAANGERKRIQESDLADAEREIESSFEESTDFGLVAGHDGWHRGTIGIVASRLCSRYQRPSAVIAFDEHGQGRGSCRSVESVDIIEVLDGCSDLLTSFGGHRLAAGFLIEKRQSEPFRMRFNDLCAEKLRGRDLRPVQTVDAWINHGEADERLFNAVQRLGPLGMGNPPPTWGLKNVSTIGKPTVVGKDHLRMTVASGGTQFDAIAFGMAGCPVPEGPMDILFHLQENNYKGRRRLEMNIKDFKASRKS